MQVTTVIIGATDNIGHREPMTWTMSEAHADDLAYARKLASGDPTALSRFERQLARVPLFVARLRLSSAQLDELKQELRVRLLAPPDAKVLAYGGRGPFEGWLRVVAVRLGLRMIRAHRADDEPSELIASGASPELLLMKEHLGELVNAAATETFATLAPEERALLRGYFFDGLTLEALGRLLGVHTATAARRLASTQERLLEGVRKRLGASGLARAEIESVLRLVSSRLDAILQ